ncbi:hypothetical protein LCGC14_1792060 [marine sediment metagenome]|uniref:Uncharacterized protein n=1 Tax=marine sediment metagenome TaxID=412755 RepID=A0A0F9GS89_9ZZZZ
MQDKFNIGDRVWVRNDEGLDTPHEARGRYGTVTGHIGSQEEGTRKYLVKGRNFAEFNFCDYHIVALPVNCTIPESLKDEFRAAIGVGDPELWERLQKANEDPEFANFSITTVAFVAMWLGCEAIIAGTHGLRECDIFER